MNRVAFALVIALGTGLVACRSMSADTTLPAETRRVGRSESVVYRLPGMDQVERARVRYDERLSMDIYYPAGYDFSTKLPAVIFTMGYPDEDFLLWTRMRLKDLGMYVAWSQLIAASGMIAVTYETDQPNEDLLSVLDYLRSEGDRFGIDGTTLGLWTCSGNTSIAVNALTTRSDGSESVRCAVAYYPIVPELLLPGADPSSLYEGMRSDVPILIAKAGQDKPASLNRAIDRFADTAGALCVPVEVLTHEHGGHGFDIHTPDQQSQEIIVRTLEFLKTHLAD